MKKILKNKLLIILGLVFIICMSLPVLSNIKNQKHAEKRYENAQDFILNSDIPYYEMYDACAYIVEGKKQLLSEVEDISFGHFPEHTDRYSGGHRKLNELSCVYHITYGYSYTNISGEVLDHQLSHGLLSIGKDDLSHEILINYSSSKVSYYIIIQLSTTEPINLKDYEQRIIDYAEDVYALHN